MNILSILHTFENLTNKEKERLLKEFKVKSFVELHLKINESLKKTLNVIENQDLINASKFVRWNDDWNEYGIYGSKREVLKEVASKTYSRGRILFIDFGHHNIGREFSHNHAGVVLKDFGSVIEVLPITSDKGKKFSSDIEKAIIRVKKADYNQFDNNSILLTHQIQSISKNRIIKDLHKTIAKTELMVQIEERLSFTYAPYYSKKQNDEINSLSEKVLQLEEEIRIMSELTKGITEVTTSEKLIASHKEIVD
ncbi:type II toxin-antitoxin system PemK/MazF family toxin [Halalkalibacter oceani]|uniref:type II toxin-antitoxin system PemK/MazF family toxin n=1 Tax=Halalkalibacter oceani TaxID=1653776 RepID=UPI003398CB1F